LGYGLGKRLIAKMIDVCMCDEITNISLYTFISRKTAYNWYLKLGFEVSKTLDFNTRAFMIGKVAIIKRNLGETN
jgi:ribosomal protein S18 acetylase RimI-like enzyme